MSEGRKPVAASPNALAQVVRTLRLTWRLLIDPRVNLFPKLIPVAALAYVVSPVDLLPDFILGLGQLDDFGIILLGMALFFESCPKEIVAEHRRALDGKWNAPTPDDNVIDGSYRVVQNGDPPRQADAPKEIAGKVNE